MHRQFAELEKEMWERFAVANLYRFDFAKKQEALDDHTMIERCGDAEDSATAIAKVIRPIHWVTRAQYTLFLVDAAWRINDIGYFCKVCDGSGKSPNNDDVCIICHGKGYFSAPELPRNPEQSEPEDPHPSKGLASPIPDIDQFMHEFLLAERALHRRYFELEKEMWERFAIPNLRRSDLAEILAEWEDYSQVETFTCEGRKATAMATVVRSSQMLIRAQYSLRHVVGAWRISGVEHECHCCNGSGSIRFQNESGYREDVCFVCHGGGWFATNNAGSKQSADAPSPGPRSNP